ncbi:MAG: tRNA threonylcarbamoyladenosine dehydratase [Syntrophomonas sp.]|nr:tRNA threonylcarbamoyladenosine dehydratase [Syntrophomonas sp.]
MAYEFSRTEMLIGKKAVAKLHSSKVAIFGIGGVGTFAVEALVRSGVGKLVLVDDDCISPSNINRQLHATHNTIGRPKVEVMKERILDINPRAEVLAHQTFYRAETAFSLIFPDYDYIIDAIDSTTSKIDLILNAKAQNIPIISSMGAGNKLDPTRFQVADIYDTSVCPLAKVIRRELRKRGVSDLKVVYSQEEPVKILEHEDPDCPINCVSLREPDEPPHQHRQIPGSIAFVPSVAGLIIAGEVIKDLIRSNV